MKIEIIGRGNLGWHLAEALRGKADANPVNPRTFEKIRKDSDLYLVCVSDNAIRDVAARTAAIMPSKAILAHTSGTTPMSILEGLHREIGVFYPLQTFTKGKALDYREIPVLLEGNSEWIISKLEEAARLFSGNVLRTTSEERKDIHIASVMSCNFVNHLWRLSHEYLESKGIGTDILFPLIRETMRKAEELSPKEAQTGPARRNDTSTIERHLERLKQNPELYEIYLTLTSSIRNKYS